MRGLTVMLSLHDTHQLISLHLRRPLLYDGLQQAYQRGNVAGPLPQQWGQQEGEHGHVRLWHRALKKDL